MIIDSEAVFAVAIAHDDTPLVVDMQAVAGNVGTGPGQPIKCFIQGSGLTGATGFTVKDGPDAGSATNDLIDHTGDLVDKLIEFELPSDVDGFVAIDLVGATAGTWSAGVILPGAQTAV